jgi:hypothetical protein
MKCELAENEIVKPIKGRYTNGGFEQEFHDG